MFYSFIGWCMEEILILYQFKKFVNRGFLIGFYCPIYGLGALLITFLLQNFTESPILLFFLALIICSVLEYSTSYILEKIFHARWWDYSNNKYNINGRICLDTMIPFGILGMIMMYFINPGMMKLFNMLNKSTLSIIFYIIFIIFITDIIISVTILLNVRHDAKTLNKDNTEEKSKKVIEKIKNQGLLFKRLFLAFPTFKYISKIRKKSKRKV